MTIVDSIIATHDRSASSIYDTRNLRGRDSLRFRISDGDACVRRSYERSLISGRSLGNRAFPRLKHRNRQGSFGFGNSRHWWGTGMLLAAKKRRVVRTKGGFTSATGRVQRGWFDEGLTGLSPFSLQGDPWFIRRVRRWRRTRASRWTSSSSSARSRVTRRSSGCRKSECTHRAHPLTMGCGRLRSR